MDKKNGANEAELCGVFISLLTEALLNHRPFISGITLRHPTPGSGTLTSIPCQWPKILF